MKNPLRRFAKFPKDIQLQSLVLLLAIVVAFVFPSHSELSSKALVMTLGSLTSFETVAPTRKVPLFTRKARFNIAIETLEEGAAKKRSPEVVAYYQKLQERIKRGTVTIRKVAEPVDAIKPVAGQPPQLIKGNLSFEMNDEIQKWVTYFTKTDRGRTTMQIALQRAGRYLPMAQSIFEREGVPTDLVFLAQAESTWLARVESHAAAKGIWQFIPETGSHYGLTQNEWVDERSDPERSTLAAALYLRDLYHLFNDWPLAMAAYNTGENRVARSIVENGRADFWELYKKNLIPNETRNYVPIILAIITVVKDYEAHGFTVNFAPPLQYEAVTVDGPVSLQLVADSVGTSLEEIQALNPQFNRDVTAPKGQPIYLPPNTSGQVLATLEEIPLDKRRHWRVREVQAGEDLTEIAADFEVDFDELRSVNRLEGEVAANTARLLIPISAAAVAESQERTVVVKKRGSSYRSAYASKRSKRRATVSKGASRAKVRSAKASKTSARRSTSARKRRR